MHLLALALLVAAPAAAAPAATPAPAVGPVSETLPPGTVSMSFGFPGGGSPWFTGDQAAIGVGYFVAPRTAVQLTFGLSTVFTPNSSAPRTSVRMSAARSTAFAGMHA